MRRIHFMLGVVLLLFVGCENTSPAGSQPIPPDDLSNGPWKHQDANKATPPE